MSTFLAYRLKIETTKKPVLLHRGSGNFKSNECEGDDDDKDGRELYEFNEVREFPPFTRPPVAIF